ncbi:hypothetical protein L873DRAFT_1798489 [Choiromyces venosus 120613-1]|uniref:Uncharacterized protein n=1 Tax=Choiromyces venosus 120613-1 TaxID=1336337 RepID=A0A3N4K6P2_9PEZI|nr:hypothetical protein L873DRAFT_1798489 [Choiromyces venosus 120613-1]
MDLRAGAPNIKGAFNEHLATRLYRFADSEEYNRLVASARKTYFDYQKSSAGMNT